MGSIEPITQFHELALQLQAQVADSQRVTAAPQLPGVVRVLIADDHELFADNLRATLAIDDRIDVVGIARTGAEAVELAQELLPDVVLMDLQMPVMDGLEATKRIRDSGARTQVIVLTGVGSSADAAKAHHAGAAGFVTKARMAADLLDSFHEVATMALVFGRVAARPLDD